MKRLRILTRIVALATATLVAAPSVAWAAPSEGDPLVEAKELYETGRAKFDTADFIGAIDDWTLAYSKLPDTPETAETKALLLYNVAAAREKAYDISDDDTHLKQARVLLQSFQPLIDDLFPDAEEAAEVRTRVEERLESIEAKLEEAANKPEPEPDPEPEPEPEPEPDEPTQSNVRPTDDRQKPNALLIAGASATAVGGGMLAVMIAGLVVGNQANDISDLADDDLSTREDRFNRGRTANTLAIVGAVATPILLGVGVPLIIVGKKRERKAAVLPSFGPGYAGVGLSGRF